MTITLYDLPSTAPQKAFSPNTWKVRYALNYKKLAYKTEWIDFIDIEPRCKELGIPHTALKPNGSPHYTVPAIYDSKTGLYLSDSFAIVEYLERTYPETPSLFPLNSIGLQLPFDSVAVRFLAPTSLWNFITPAIFSRVLPASRDYFRRTREARFNKVIEEMTPQGDTAINDWNQFKESLGTIDLWYKCGGGSFLMGDTLSWADISVGSFIIFLRTIFGEESEQWKDIASWHDGRWTSLMRDLKPYQVIV